MIFSYETENILVSKKQGTVGIVAACDDIEKPFDPHYTFSIPKT